MSLSEKRRSSIYLTLAPMLGEEEAEALLSQFPARELDEPVTKEFVRAEIAGVRTEMAEMRAAIEGSISELRTELYDRLRQHDVDGRCARGRHGRGQRHRLADSLAAPAMPAR